MQRRTAVDRALNSFISGIQTKFSTTREILVRLIPVEGTGEDSMVSSPG